MSPSPAKSWQISQRSYTMQYPVPGPKAPFPRVTTSSILSVIAVLTACGGGTGSDNADKSSAMIQPLAETAASAASAESPASAASDSQTSAAALQSPTDTTSSPSATIQAAKVPSPAPSTATAKASAPANGSLLSVKPEQTISTALPAIGKNTSIAPAPTPTPTPTPAPAPAPAPAGKVATPAPAPSIGLPPIPPTLPNTGSATINAIPVVPAIANTPAEAENKSPSNTQLPALGVEQRALSAAKPLAAADIFAQIDPTNTFRSSGWIWSVECAGLAKGAIDVPETGIQGNDLGSGLGTLRFGKTSDPDAPNRKVLLFRANKNDPLQAGAPRCELGVSPTQAGKLQIGKDFWFGFGVRLDKWVTGPEEQIIAQIHQPVGALAGNPIFALSVFGDKLVINARFNNNKSFLKETTTGVTLWSQAALPTKAWTYFVIKAKISSDTAINPYLQVWRDGQKIVDYKGAFGYNAPEAIPFAKIGHYQWGGSGNIWPDNAATKTVLFRTPTFVNELATNPKYQEVDIREHVRAR
ncbi:polysaccharide lyase [Paucibacter sp. AS339]|uniref:polysaccharide lyase n=1 Tax=Paucibacter hankyongi TaxID=3133434 RepID=UPI0030A70AA1